MIKVSWAEKINFKPVKLDVTYADDGSCVQWNGSEWLPYNSKEAEDFRQKYLEEFNKFPFRQSYLNRYN